MPRKPATNTRTRAIGLGCLLGLTALFAAVGGCSSLPPLDGRTPSTALHQSAARETELGQLVSPVADRHPGKTGIFPLPNALEAFATRMRLSQVAEQTLDVQYYIWRADTTGLLLLQALIDAADRGVRVRLLLDDMNTAGLDSLLRAANAHPNLQIRLFNPFVIRSPRFVGFLTDFSRLNHRMHNKSFTADNQVAVVGGRNVGDEYFGAAEGVQFNDLDVLAVGDVVNDVSVDFDRYWASPSAYPAALILGQDDTDNSDDHAAVFADLKDEEATRLYLDAIEQLALVRQLHQGKLPLIWTTTRMVSDSPGKALDRSADAELLTSQLIERIGNPVISLDLVSPYFIPRDTGVEALGKLVARGVRVRVLTNSLSATDVAVVHSGYARYRKALLQAGVELYELKAQPSDRTAARRVRRLGSSATSLHAKTFAVDRHKVFVGSFNFDPRSTRLNTELGFLIQSPLLAHEITAFFDQEVPLIAYEVRLDEAGDLYWIDQSGSRSQSLATEPETSAWSRFSVRFFSWFPIEGLL